MSRIGLYMGCFLFKFIYFFIVQVQLSQHVIVLVLFLAPTPSPALPCRLQAAGEAAAPGGCAVQGVRAAAGVWAALLSFLRVAVEGQRVVRTVEH